MMKWQRYTVYWLKFGNVGEILSLNSGDGGNGLDSIQKSLLRGEFLGFPFVKPTARK